MIEKVLEILGVNIDEEFWIREKSTLHIYKSDIYYLDKRLKLCSKNPNLKYDYYLGDLIVGDYEVVKILKPIEPFLTDREKAFFSYLNFDEIDVEKSYCLFFLTDGVHMYYIDMWTLKTSEQFNLMSKLTEGKRYNKKELGLED